MHHNPIPPIVLAAALSACSVQPELLNSERIEKRFGNYGIEIIAQQGSVRRSSLYSTENSLRTCRTYAIVQFVDPDIIELAGQHQAILSGESIGTTIAALVSVSLAIGVVSRSDTRARFGAVAPTVNIPAINSAESSPRRPSMNWGENCRSIPTQKFTKNERAGAIRNRGCRLKPPEKYE